MVDYRTDEERLSAIINFFNDYKKFFVWGSVGLFLIVLVFISVSSSRIFATTPSSCFLN